MKSFTRFLAVSLTIGSLALHAAEPATELKTADEVVARWMKAVGGDEAVHKLKTRKAKASIEITSLGLNLTLEVWSKAPNKSYAVIEVPNFGNIEDVCDGTAAWTVQPGADLKEKEGDDLAEAKRNADFYRAYELKRAYSKLEFKGSGKAGDEDCYVLEGTPASGGVDKLYFSKGSGLLVQEARDVITPTGKAAGETRFEDYKEVDGVKLAHTVRLVKPAEVGMVFKTLSVQHNVEIDDAKFKKPAAK